MCAKLQLMEHKVEHLCSIALQTYDKSNFFSSMVAFNLKKKKKILNQANDLFLGYLSYYHLFLYCVSN